MTKHTPGPWVVEHWSPIGKHSPKMPHIYSGGFLVAEVENEFADDEGVANAQLIAAAPDLLEALEHLVYECEEGCNLTIFNVIDKEAKPAIAKAKGEL